MNAQPLNIQDLLNQVLSAGKDMAAKGKSQSAGAIEKGKELGLKGEDLLIEKLGLEDTPKVREALRKGLGTGAAAGGILLLLSSKSGRKLAALGGLGSLGMLAYKAYQKNGGTMSNWRDEVVGMISGPKADARSKAILRAMISAAKADGTISTDEIALIKDHDSDELGDMLDQPCDPIAIARLADSGQAEREIYAASCRIANGLNEKERDYLDNLAMALRLDPELAARIETDVRTG
ncbi:MAG: DUF533 domain-containing protein [Hellea sp.]|nr:DUF533 domain-containing protein [Hellea sp.]